MRISIQPSHGRVVSIQSRGVELRLLLSVRGLHGRGLQNAKTGVD
jgi:hypothetical protein